MYIVSFIAKIIESRNNSSYAYSNGIKFHKDIKVEFPPSNGMTIDAFGIKFVVSAHANLDTGLVKFEAEGSKKFIWMPADGSGAKLLIKKLQDAGFSKEKEF